MWELKVQMKGDEPSDEAEIDKIADEVAAALDKADIDYFDVTL